jgi:hypothetical protein
MTILIVMQFYSPQTAWVNRGVGGDMEGTRFGGALGYCRPPGIFSFVSGYVFFQLIVFCFLLYYLLRNKTLDKSQQIRPLLLWVMLGCYIVSIPYSISRTHFFQTIVVVFFMMAGTAQMKQFRYKLTVVFALLIFIFGIVVKTGIAKDSIAVTVLTARFENAGQSEGGLEGTIGTRYLGSVIRAYNQNLPFAGYGIGIGTNAGAKWAANGDIWKFFNGEEEWSRITGECGALIGWIIIITRCLFSLYVLKKALYQLRKKHDLLPWLLSAGMLLMIPKGQMGFIPALGFLVLIGGIALASVKTNNSLASKCILYRTPLLFIRSSHKN